MRQLKVKGQSNSALLRAGLAQDYMSRKSVLKKSSDESSLEEKLLPLDMQRFAARCRPACSCYLAAVQLFLVSFMFGFSSHVGVPVS